MQLRQLEKLERAAGGLLAEVGDGPPGDTAVKEHASEGFVAGLAAVARPAADVQAPAEAEADLRAVGTRSWLKGAVCGLDDRRLELRVPWKMKIVSTIPQPQTRTPEQPARTAMW